MDLRDCFRTNYGVHLRIVISAPEKDAANVLVVNITTLRIGKFHDPACVLEVGDHPFIKHQSYIAFQYARTRANVELDQMLASGRIILEDANITEYILAKIHAGASVSNFIALEYEELLRNQGFIE